MVKIRCPKDDLERLTAALNSTNEDLYVENCRVIITGKNLNGEIIYLGDVAESALYQKDVDPNNIINFIRFNQ